LPPSQSRVAGLAKASGPGRSAAEPWGHSSFEARPNPGLFTNPKSEPRITRINADNFGSGRGALTYKMRSSDIFAAPLSRSRIRVNSCNSRLAFSEFVNNPGNGRATAGRARAFGIPRDPGLRASRCALGQRLTPVPHGGNGFCPDVSSNVETPTGGSRTAPTDRRSAVSLLTVP